MRLAIDSLETVLWLDSASVLSIIVKDTHYYAKIVRSFFSACEDFDPEIEIRLVDDKEHRIEICSHMEMVLDPLMIDFSSKKITTALSNKLKHELNNDIETRSRIEEALITVQDCVENLLDDFDLPLKMETDWDSNRIVKSLAISVDDSIENLSQLEILKRYLNIVGDLKISDYFCFVGLRNVLAENELLEFFKEALINQVNVICIDSGDAPPNQNEFGKALFIDEDYEEILVPQKYEIVDSSLA